jgi:hypothetical protein
MDPTLKLYIHTWNQMSNSLSWRTIPTDTRSVTKETIYDYFGEHKHLIETILIDDDSEIQHIGNVTGSINNGPMPLLGWKNYWYGKYRIIEHVYNKDIDVNEFVINFRFDLLNNSINYKKEHYLYFIKSIFDQYTVNPQFTKNIFLHDQEFLGMDNLYIGSIHTMYKILQVFAHDLDSILSKHSDTIHQ